MKESLDKGSLLCYNICMMTKVEAIQWIELLIKTMHEETHGEFKDPEYKDEVYIALDMAIKELKKDYTNE